MLLAVKPHVLRFRDEILRDEPSFEQSLTPITEHKGTVDIAGDAAPI